MSGGPRSRRAPPPVRRRLCRAPLLALRASSVDLAPRLRQALEHDRPARLVEVEAQMRLLVREEPRGATLEERAAIGAVDQVGLGVDKPTTAAGAEPRRRDLLPAHAPCDLDTSAPHVGFGGALLAADAD